MRSDGLNEQKNADREEFGRARLVATIEEQEQRPLAESVDHLVQRVIQWRGDERLEDDVSIMAVEMLGAENGVASLDSHEP